MIAFILQIMHLVGSLRAPKKVEFKTIPLQPHREGGMIRLHTAPSMRKSLLLEDDCSTPTPRTHS